MSEKLNTLELVRAMRTPRPPIHRFAGPMADVGTLVDLRDFATFVAAHPQSRVEDRSQALEAFLQFSLEGYGRMTAYEATLRYQGPKGSEGEYEVNPIKVDYEYKDGGDDEGLCGPLELWHRQFHQHGAVIQRVILPRFFIPAGFVSLVLSVCDQGGGIWTRPHKHEHGACLPGTVVCWSEHKGGLDARDVGVDGYTGKIHLPIKSKKAKASTVPDLPPPDELDHVLRLPVAILDLSVRVSNFCRTKGVVTIGQLVKLSADDLRKEKDCGRVGLREVEGKLYDKGLHLGMTDDEIRAATKFAR